MKKEIEILRKNDCDVNGALSRFVGDEETYVSLLNVALTDPSIEQLGNALQQNDLTTAFQCAHTLKGIFGNMGFEPLYKLNVEIVESLRKGETDSLMQKFTELCAFRNKFLKMLK